MHLPIHTKTLNQYMLVALCISALVSCGGESGGSSSISSTTNTTKKRDLVSYMYVDETSQPLKGNAVWNYSVATDYYNYTQNNPALPSLTADLNANKDANIEYVFATFISLSLGYKSDGSSPALISDQCPTDSSVPQIAYYALPQIKTTIYSGVLGDCVVGQTATAYYAGINKDAPLKVVPVAEYADPTFPQFIAAATPSQMTTIASALAQKIISDKNTYGLAIDNEKSINGFNTTKVGNTTVGQQQEEFFFGELARLLAVGKKYLFLFDAPASAKALYANNKNVVFMTPLYDLDNSDPTDTTSTPYNPDHLLSPYMNSLKSVANGTLTASTAPGQSVMFVVPASATSTIWDYAMAYNYPLPLLSPTYVNPILNTPGITANGSGICSDIPREDTTNTVLTALINSPKTINDFLGAGNCYLFRNNLNKLNDYFSASLNAITTARMQNDQQANYLGAALYAWRISGINDINAVKNYPSVYTSGGGVEKVVYLQGPPEIQSTSWSTFNSWAPNNK